MDGESCQGVYWYPPGAGGPAGRQLQRSYQPGTYPGHPGQAGKYAGGGSS